MPRFSFNESDCIFVALVKGNEKYTFFCEATCRAELLRQFGRFASNPNLSFTWYDAAILSQRIRELTVTARK